MEPRTWQDPTPDHGGGGLQFAMPRLTPAVKWLLIANGAMFVLTAIVLNFEGLRGARGDLIHALALDPAAWRAWFPLVPVWQLLTYGFLHAGPGHLLGNALFLYFLGTMLEGTVGTRRFAWFFGAAVAVAGFFQLVVSLLLGEDAVILGASGGVLAIVCAMATLQPSTRIIFILFPITLKVLAWIYVAFDAFNVINQAQGGGSNVASIAHLTGAAFGFVVVRSGWIWRDPLASVERARRRRAVEGAAEDQKRLDALLARISREGIASLSPREKAFLKKMSKRR